jgi:predicted permease
MSLYQALSARMHSVFRQDGAESRMEEEFRFHVEMETERLVKSGVAPDEARRRALIAFGGLDQQREVMRDGRGAHWLSDVMADVRYAARATRRNPGFAIAVAVTLGVGIGVNGMTFGFINSILFRPVPARHPEQLVALFSTDTKTGRADQISYDDYVDFRDRSGVFDGLALFTGAPLNLVAPTPGAQGATAGDMVWGEMVTENYFTVLDMQPVIGRFFTLASAPPGANPFAILSYDSWIHRFHGDSSVVGRRVRINGTEFTITGVAARGFRGMRTFSFWPEIWTPFGMHNVTMPNSAHMLEGRGMGDMMAFGRVRPGFDRAQTERAAQLFAGRLARAFPATNGSMNVMLIPARTGFDHPAFINEKTVVLASAMSIIASIITLLIICANLANLQLARAAARGREIAIRLSLGCSRARLARQLLVESALLAVPGVMIAVSMLRLTPILEPYMLPHLQFPVGLMPSADYRVVLFTAFIGVAAATLFGVVPALRATRPSLAPSLSSVIGKQRRTRSPMRARGILVVGQLALSVILTVGGMLFVRSLMVARGRDFGFDPGNRLLLSLNVGLEGYDERRGQSLYDAVLARVRALPDVVSASWGSPVPFDSENHGASLFVEGAETTAKDQTVGTEGTNVSEGFVQSLGMRMQAGRGFVTADSLGAPPVIVVSRSLATRLWPGKDPIGRTARRGNASGAEETVVGVVADAQFQSIGEVNRTRVYFPLRQRYRDQVTLIVHTRGDPTAVLPRVRRIIASLDPSLPTFGAMTMAQAVDSGFATSRMAAVIAGFFGVLALLIASVGLYAVVAGGVTERTREIGVRMALGSTPMDVLRLVMRGGARLGAWGLAVGLIGAFFVARAMSGLLYGLSPGDPVTFALVPLVLMAVVVVATYLPARRAVKLDPVAALRSE